ncbi:LamG-like jellyroll fold domain-containing protein [Algibacter sp. Ld11]|uniref:LamG-like jellyroll fold domain-containing protein n=1 Tax=Algibacter sp. Ld11 TaxID=649150 RepID=UPI00386C046C
MKNLYSNLLSVLKNIIAIALCLFSFNFIDAQCSYDITSLVGDDLVDWNGHYISNVTINGDNVATGINNSNTNTRYTNFTGQSAEVTAGSSYSFSIVNSNNQGISWGDVQIRIWIDYNNNGNYTQVYSNSFAQNNNVTHTISGSFEISPLAATGSAKLRIQAAYCSACSGNAGALSSDGCNFTKTYRGDVEDYTLNITGATYTDPLATDDSLSVVMNSTSGTANQINVEVNDIIGNDGSDGDDFDLLTNTLNGTVTETTTDGIFEYIPNVGFLGNDSFTYRIYDANGDFDEGTVNINVSLDKCQPTTSSTDGSNNSIFLTNVNLPGENFVLNHSSLNDGGYSDNTSLYSALELYKGASYPTTIESGGHANWIRNQIFWAVFIDFNHDGDFSDAGENLYVSSAREQPTYPTQNITIPATALTGLTAMRVGIRAWTPPSSCGTSSEWPAEYEDYLVNIGIDPASAADIGVSGNGNNIANGSTTPTLTNNTDFGVYDIYSDIPQTKTFSISNNGGIDLNLIGTPTVSISGSPDFTVTTQPSTSVIATGNTTNFVVSFSPTAPIIGQRTATVSILSDDTGDSPYVFTIQGYGEQTFPDTDGDGIPNNIDLDDDNDGLPDLYEQVSCINNSIASTTDVIFLFEDFETGTSRGTIDGATYCWEDGLGTGSCNSSPNLNDGEYAVYYKASNGDGTNQTPIGEVASWADVYWYPGVDHTPNDTNGRMAMFNADYNPGVFYEKTIVGVSAGVDITYGFSAINLDRADAPDIGSRGRPSVLIEVLDPSGAIIASESSGPIQPTTNYTTGDWTEISATFNTTYTQFTVRLSNEVFGGAGNDLALDDIFVQQTLCDLDSDGVEDAVDLDNDDDGIPNVVELQLPDTDKDATVNNDTGANTWVDINNNGLLDLYDHQDAAGNNPGDAGFSGPLGIPIDLSDPKYDTDGDGVADYLDLDSDNDGIFDAVEYDNRGDVDADGDGNGDGLDIQLYDINGIAIPDDGFDGDGILSPADGNDFDNDDDDHGTANTYPTPLDDDGDGIPNFRDVDSADNPNNFANGSDIDTTQIYAHLDADNDGIIDGSGDADNDGILDAFDTDNTVYGSPRDLDGSYTLFFDGRNDYVEDISILGSLSNATLMAWVKLEPGSSGNRFIIGQDNFNLQINSTNKLRVIANSYQLVGPATLPTGIWVHIAATYNSVSGKFKTYVNGEEQKNSNISGGLQADTTPFTMGKASAIDPRYFEGEMDEVRVFNEALTELELQRMVYQELSSTFNQGAIIPLDIDAANTFGTSLIRYFKMDTIKDDIVDDETTPTIDIGTGARMYNIHNIYFQTAPLPYETVATGNWSAKATWLHGDVWDIADEINNKPWSIVHVKHSLSTSVDHGTSGLIVDTGIELEINDDVELNNSWYLNLAGKIDLEGESQLVQTKESVLVATGTIERDQQGTENLYTYNYWSSPVHSVNPNTAVDGDETYTVASVLKDGEDPDNPAAISFVGGYDGDNTSSPIEIANYWIWKFEDNLFSNYYAWQQIKSTGVLKVGEGYTMKGPGTGSIATDKNYVFEGKPNNGIIELPINAGNASLVGNPYPSAIDANQFIADNTHLDGALYFWEHYGGGSHILKEYQGGYATYNLSGGAPAVASVGVDQVNGTATKIPAQFVPVGQGFYVKANSNGDVTFNNGQRVFMTEASSSNSLFVRGTAQKSTVATTDTSLEDLRTKFRVNYNSPNGYVRQLLTTIDENASIELDRGYDASLIEEGAEDMFWMIGENSYVIQGIDQPAETTTLPLSVKTKTAGEIVISLAELKYPTEGFELYLKDNLTETYHDLLENPTYTTSVEQGITANRFEIVFAKQVNTLSVSDNEIAQNAVGVYYDNTALHITNPNNASIEKITGNNILGQSVLNEVINSSDKNITLPANLALGIYIFTIETDHSTITKKMIIN